MHELGVLKQVVGIVEQVAIKNNIKAIKYITLEVGLDSGIVPRYLSKLMPVAVDFVPILKNAELHIRTICGKGLVIKDIGY